MPRLNLGCGQEYLKGYKNIDISRNVKADEYYDIREGIREADNSIDEVFAGCFIEQIDSNDKFIYVLNEIWRVLKPNGIFEGYVPSTDPSVLFLDPMDRRFFQLESFRYLEKGHRLYERFGKNYGFKPWKVIKLEKRPNGIIYFKLEKIND